MKLERLEWNVVSRMQLNNTVERILHVPGNYTGGILEMSIVWDDSMDVADAQTIIKNIAQTLKVHSEVFRNVRVNVVHWKSDMSIQNEVVPLIRLTMDSYYNQIAVGKDDTQADSKQLVLLMEYLKKFHARSKLILFVTSGEYENPQNEEEQQQLKKSMEPFLEKKLARIYCKDDNISIGYRNWLMPV